MRFIRLARRSGLIMLAALTLAVSACSVAAPATGSPGPGPAVTQDAAPVAALDFAGPTLDGATLDAATLAGTPVVLWFWAPWCTICRAEAPDVAAVAAEFDGRVRVLGVPGRGEIEAMREFVADTGTAGITHVTDVDGALWNRFGVVTQPAFVFVDRSGAVQSFAGSLGGQGLRDMLAGLA
jgi:thiol-disulfide isomerase/thioredoxin